MTVINNSSLDLERLSRRDFLNLLSVLGLGGFMLYLLSVLRNVPVSLGQIDNKILEEIRSKIFEFDLSQFKVENIFKSDKLWRQRNKPKFPHDRTAEWTIRILTTEEGNRKVIQLIDEKGSPVSTVYYTRYEIEEFFSNIGEPENITRGLISALRERRISQLVAGYAQTEGSYAGHGFGTSMFEFAEYNVARQCSAGVGCARIAMDFSRGWAGRVIKRVLDPVFANNEAALLVAPEGVELSVNPTIARAEIDSAQDMINILSAYIYTYK